MAFLDYNTDFQYFVRARFNDLTKLDEWHDWYDNTHIPKLLGVPGIRGVTRYQELGSPDRFLTAYDLERPEVLTSEAYTSFGGRWGGGWREYVDDWRRAIYQLHERLPAGD